MWMNPHDIPLDSVYHWVNPATSAHLVTSPLLAFEQVCGSAPLPWRTDIERFGFTARSAPFGGGGFDWQGLQLIIKPPGAGGDSVTAARGLFAVLDIELTKGCANEANGTRAVVTWSGDGSASRTTGGYSGLAAVITGGAAGELHDYLLVAQCPNTAAVSELALWATHPSHPWSAPTDTQVLGAMNTALCSGDIG
jgi:hypothetical protein